MGQSAIGVRMMSNLAQAQEALSELSAYREIAAFNGFQIGTILRSAAVVVDQAPMLLAELKRLQKEVNELKLCLDESAENGGTWNV